MERLKMSTLSILVLSLMVVMGCAAAYPPPAFAGWKTIVGEAPMQGDEAAAEQQAINNALQKVVSSTAGAMIQSNTQIQNGQVVMNSIMANAAGYVRSYNVLSSGPSTDGTRYVVTLECDVLTDNIQQTIASMESNFQTHQNQMQNPRVLVLGIRLFGQDLAWATKPFTMAVQTAKQKLNQARYIVLHHTAIENYDAVVGTLKSGTLNDAALKKLAQAANADFVYMLRMDATFKPRSNTNPFNEMGIGMSVNVFDVNTDQFNDGRSYNDTMVINAANPNNAEKRETLSQLAIKASEIMFRESVLGQMKMMGDSPHIGTPGQAPAPMVAPAMPQAVPMTPMVPSTGLKTQMYMVTFESYLDQHVDSFLNQLNSLPGIQRYQVIQQTQNLTKVQIFFNGLSNNLRTGLKQILLNHGYSYNRINQRGKSLVFKNTSKF